MHAQLNNKLAKGPSVKQVFHLLGECSFHTSRGMSSYRLFGRALLAARKIQSQMMSTEPRYISYISVVMGSLYSCKLALHFKKLGQLAR